MEQHTPNGQEPHPLWHNTRNTIWRNNIETNAGAKYARAVVIIIDVVLCGFLGDLQLTFRQANPPYFRLRSASAD